MSFNVNILNREQEQANPNIKCVVRMKRPWQMRFFNFIVHSMMEKKDMQQQQQQHLIKEVSNKKQNCSVCFLLAFLHWKFFLHPIKWLSMCHNFNLNVFYLLLWICLRWHFIWFLLPYGCCCCCCHRRSIIRNFLRNGILW